ncbi:MAG: carbon-nitrogen hydrolase family protein [Gammaproteobacteria bacterium]|nr:carbon-nitrogen hydrolase family protein [Gammaproteobacteria bacterium]
MTIAAAIQMASGTNVSANLLEAARLVEAAAKAGAELIVLPENFALMAMRDPDKFEHLETEGVGPMQEMLSQSAARHGVWIVGGTVPLATTDSGRAAQTCLVYDSKGRQVARYDKIHLFDVAIETTNERYNESATTAPGNRIVVIDSPFGRLGLSVCYDLRFPELYRAMLAEGMEIAVVPSAFTKTTGFAHWDILVRARAIENSAYVIAAAQGGFHVNGRETYGSSMIVNPWGTIISADLPLGSGFTLAKIDVKGLRHLRRKFPAVDHRVLQCTLPGDNSRG